MRRPRIDAAATLSRARARRRVCRRACLVPVAALAFALAGGCASSPPVRFYTLTPIAPETRLTVPPGTAQIQLNRLTVPAELDRLSLVRRIDATRLQIADDDRWAAPLDDMIRRVLSADLAARLPENLVIDPNQPQAGERRQSLAVDFQDLYADAGCAVTLRATWVLTAPPAQNASTKNEAGAGDRMQVSEELQVPSGSACSGAAAVPGVMSRALASLSDRIAAHIAQTSAAERQP